MSKYQDPSECQRCPSPTPVTLDTPLSQIAWDDADSIGDDLIDITIAGDEWGLAWSRVVRAGGTVRDLRDDLYSRLGSIPSEHVDPERRAGGKSLIIAHAPDGTD